MLVVISDLHLTDESCGSTVKEGAFRTFVELLRTRVEAACWADGPGGPVFRPIEGCDVVLLGDILDLLRSTVWEGDGAPKPWWAPDKLLAPTEQVVDRVLAANAAGLAHWRDLGGQLLIPPDGPNTCSEPVPIPLRFHYLVGNHDWPLHLPGPGWDALRRKVCAALGLSNDPAQPFPHELDELPALADLCHRHRVWLRHGDIFDPLNFSREHGRAHSSAGDAVVIDIVNSFPRRVQHALDLADDHPIALAFHDTDNLRPLVYLPAYVQYVANTYATPAQRAEILKVWYAAGEPFLDNRFVQAMNRPGLDTVSLLRLFLRLQRQLPIMTLDSVARLYWRFNGPDSYARHAHREPLLRDGKVDFIVYGHTHHAEQVPLRDGGPQQEQRYFNTGTWRRLHERTHESIRRPRFVSAHVMNVLVFYRRDERNGHRFENWAGLLD